SIVNPLSKATTGRPLNPGTASNSATGRGVSSFGGSGNTLGGTTAEARGAGSGNAEAGILLGGGKGGPSNSAHGDKTGARALGNAVGGPGAGADDTGEGKTDSGGGGDVDAGDNGAKGSESDTEATDTQDLSNARRGGAGDRVDGVDSSSVVGNGLIGRGVPLLQNVNN